MEIDVKGHSGCLIEIINEDNELYVMKSSSNPKYYDRLIKQAQKQDSAAKLKYQHIRIPQILSVKKGMDIVQVKMEYVYSKNFVEFFESAGFEQIDCFVEALKRFIDTEISLSPQKNISSSLIKDKYINVKENVMMNSLLNTDSNIKEIMDFSERIFSNLSDMTLPLGICHGDLTFSNILFNGSNYYLIDFLDSFIESPLMDVVKIRQDSTYQWSRLMYVKPIDRTRFDIICAKIDDELNNYFDSYEWYRNYYKTFQLMNILRVLQYAKEEKTVAQLKKILNGICNEF